MKTKIVISLGLLAFVLVQCKQTEQYKVSTKFEPGKPLTEHRNKKIKEVSGLASSLKNPGLMWAQNDSGNDAEIYLINNHLEIVFTCRLANAENRDWEDIAVGPGPDSTKTYIYIADIGDNDAVYPEKIIYRLEEPIANLQVQDTVIKQFDKIVFRLEDAVKDTESLLLDHKTRNLYVISKRESPVYLYELTYPYESEGVQTARKKLSLPFSYAVGADFCFSNGDVLIKNYESVFYWENSGKDDLITLLSRKPVNIPYAPEPQGEAITWSIDGSGFYTLSEREKKEKSFLYFYRKL
jgi:hypothetical protein